MVGRLTRANNDSVLTIDRHSLFFYYSYLVQVFLTYNNIQPIHRMRQLQNCIQPRMMNYKPKTTNTDSIQCYNLS